jgi:hypothetical protein
LLLHPEYQQATPHPLYVAGADEDIVTSSARAYVSALNKMIGYISVQGRTNAAAAAAEGGSNGSAAAGQKDAVVA